MRPTARPAVNQRVPSRPAAMADSAPLSAPGTAYSRTVPPRVMWPIRPRPGSVNHTLPSRTAAMPPMAPSPSPSKSARR